MLLKNAFMYLLAACLYFFICNCGGSASAIPGPGASGSRTSRTSSTLGTCAGQPNRTSTTEWTSYNASYECVNDVVNNHASADDTINVPSGSFTWTSTLTITRGMIIKGAGIDSTIITNSTGTPAVSYEPNATARTNDEKFEISGFTFDGNDSSNVCGMIRILNKNTTVITKIKIHDNKIKNLKYVNGTGRGIAISGLVYGVAYSNIFDRVRNVITSMGYDQYSWANLSQAYGSVNNFYFEDNIILASSSTTDSGGNETGQGGNLVMRYNTWDYTNTTTQYIWDQHGLQTPSSYTTPSVQTCEQYSTMVGEYYGNILTNIYSNSRQWMNYRGGWMLMFNNTATGTGSLPNALQYSEYACDACAKYGVYSQHISNSYIWNNTNNGSRKDLFKNLDSCGDYGDYAIASSRDYFNYNASCTATSCSSGVGTGSATPTGTCTAGVAYWKTSYPAPSTPPVTMADMKTYTQAGTLYKCTSTDKWEVYYTPYTYPHPLR